MTEELSSPVRTTEPFYHLIVLFSELVRLGVFSYPAYLSTLIARGEIKSPIVPLLPFAREDGPAAPPYHPRPDPEPGLSLSISLPALKKARLDNNNSLASANSATSVGPLSPANSADFGFALDTFMSGDGASPPLQVFQSEESGSGGVHDEESVAIFHERKQQLELLASESHQENFVPPLNFNSPTHDTDGPPSPLVPPKSDPFSFSPTPAFPAAAGTSSLFLDEEQLDPVTNKHASRHLLFAAYFPISEPLLTVQELNKRAVVLCGVGKTRARVERVVRKIGDEVEHFLRLLNGLSTPILPILPESVLDFRLLPSFEQRVLATTCEGILRSTLKSTPAAAAAAAAAHATAAAAATTPAATAAVAAASAGGGGAANSAGTLYYPACAQLVFVCELLELSGGIQQIIDLLVDVIACELDRPPPPLPENLCLPVIGLLHKYCSCLLLSQQNTTVVFEK